MSLRPAARMTRRLIGRKSQATMAARRRRDRWMRRRCAFSSPLQCLYFRLELYFSLLLLPSLLSRCARCCQCTELLPRCLYTVLQALLLVAAAALTAIYHVVLDVASCCCFQFVLAVLATSCSFHVRCARCCQLLLFPVCARCSCHVVLIPCSLSTSARTTHRLIRHESIGKQYLLSSLSLNTRFISYRTVLVLSALCLQPIRSAVISLIRTFNIYFGAASSNYVGTDREADSILTTWM
jgi:hypothetical protein